MLTESLAFLIFIHFVKVSEKTSSSSEYNPIVDEEAKAQTSVQKEPMKLSQPHRTANTPSHLSGQQKRDSTSSFVTNGFETCSVPNRSPFYGTENTVDILPGNYQAVLPDRNTMTPPASDVTTTGITATEVFTYSNPVVKNILNSRNDTSPTCGSSYENEQQQTSVFIGRNQRASPRRTHRQGKSEDRLEGALELAWRNTSLK